MTKEGKTFNKRFEKKYIVNTAVLAAYIDKNDEILKSTLTSDHVKKDAAYTLIENIYFDNDQLDSYHQSVEKTLFRKKLRLRTYAVDGKVTDLAFFEIKRKEFEQTLKERVVFKTSWLDAFIGHGYYQLAEVCAVNPLKTPAEVSTILNKIGHLLHEQGYHPILKSGYKRLAFKLKQQKNALRITIDTDLSFTRLRNSRKVKLDYHKTLHRDQSIIEIKYKGEKDLDEIYQIHHDLGEASGFSKYCYGIFSTEITWPKKMSGPAICSLRPVSSARTVASLS